MKRILFIVLFLLLQISLISQTIEGKITDFNLNPLAAVNISIIDQSGGLISDKDGLYKVNIKANRSYVIAFSFIGYETEKIRVPMLKKGQKYTLNISLKKSNTLLDDIIVKDQKSRKNNLSRIKTKHVEVIPGSGGGIESVLKTLPGVSSANELSSQYSVRGGNFDENLVYVNGIEVYRPFLIHSGQQEGLSFVNTDLVGSILFSAGGFSAKYGDKMSSVLDIKYKQPKKIASSLSLSLLGGSAHLEGISKNRRLSYLIGIRHKSNQYLLSSLDTEAEYVPRFSDLQTYLNYKINTNWDISLLTNISKNQYQMIPQDRNTDFGTFNEALRLTVFFEGQELDKYKTYFGALSTRFNPNTKVQLELTGSAFQTFEQENFDILGEYWLYQLDNNLGSDNFGDVAFDRGVGKYIKHARNSLDARVINFSHKGNYNDKDISLVWGLKFQNEDINDRISEWTLIDSAGFTLPHPYDSIGSTSNSNQQVLMNEILKTDINISSTRQSGYLEYSQDLNNFSLNAGTRSSYWSYNEELLVSPRVSLAYAPNWEKDVVFRLASGIYYQSPFYKELRYPDGRLNNSIESQKSTHYVIGSDYLFYKWGRPFKWITELYYKKLDNLIPYKVDNVRIQYLAENNSKGYATGVDFKINGEFVSGVESWASLSIMQTEEDLIGDSYIDENGNIVEPGYIPRPTDQRVNFSLFFQDYIPGNLNYKMHLNMIYGSGLPFGPPKSEKYEDILRIPDYRRVDIGFSAILKSENKRSRVNFMNVFNSAWLSVEVFNLLDINNTISYLWVSDIGGRQYAVPNYLTRRQVNLKLILRI
ncbi:TonB-dependent receptor [Flavobacteriales bacterium]|nr:TonB-dependent receptor [Flavobacteriales bacterium]